LNSPAGIEIDFGMTDDQLSQWGDSDLPADCLAWVTEVDRVMKRSWFIDSGDAGWSRDDVIHYWGFGEPPEQFVDRYAEKYGLIHAECLNPFVAFSSPKRR
jgi:hypothetical protein